MRKIESSLRQMNQVTAKVEVDMDKLNQDLKHKVDLEIFQEEVQQYQKQMS